MEENAIHNTEKEEGIDLAEIFSVLFAKLVWILLAAVLCAGGTFAYAKYKETPVYRSTVTIYFVSEGMANASDITLATYYAQDYARLIKKRPVLERAIADLGVDMTYGQLASYIDVSIEEQSRILDIVVTHPDPAMAQILADGVAVATKQMMEEKLVKDERAVIWGTADLPKAPITSNVFSKAVVAGMIGLLLASAAVIAIYFYDDKLRTPENIEKMLGLTVLASIPEEAPADAKEKAAKEEA